ncbi:MAG: hypothetical protein GWP08_06835 [Nitrospiraceae bacterium]|nr:hypothetical protein [Nitrospiraceae bacterium]
MMTVSDCAKYQRHRAMRDAGPASRTFLYELAWPLLLFASLGAITWAVRGTGGWDGIEGTYLPGMSWGLLWYYLCYRKGIDARNIPFWLGLGIALGGELGYGQYVSWMQGRFQVADGTIPIANSAGYLWFFICGMGWAAPGAIFLGWALSEKTSLLRWTMRVVVPLGVAYLAWFLVQKQPAWFFPHYDTGIYAELCDPLERTVYTNTQNFGVVAWWLGAMIVAAFQRDKFTLVVGAIVGIGFGPGFLISALWCWGYTYAPGFTDWWKMWELHAGFNLGILYVITLYWATRQVDKAHEPDGTPRAAPAPSRIPPRVVECLKNISLIMAAFVLFFIAFKGGTYGMGLYMEFYGMADFDQYDWPASRVWLFAPFLTAIAGLTLFAIARAIYRACSDNWRNQEVPRLPERIAAMMFILTFIGAVTIWTTGDTRTGAKIGTLYVVFLGLAFAAYNRLNAHFDEIDAQR